MIDISLALFAKRIAPFVAGPLTVQLVPELEPELVTFLTSAPDRLLAGADAFRVLRGKGFAEATHAPTHRRVALPPAHPDRFEELRLPRREIWSEPPAFDVRGYDAHL